MKTILSLSFLVFFIGCSTWNKDNEETQYLNELVIEENSKNVVPLPLIKINSYSKEIVDEPKIPAEFQIFQENIILEEHNIGIEIRGSSSQFFDKKSYGFETWDENNEDLKNHLIGRTPNWDSERIAKIDYAILITSIAELLYFPSIPPKVTINEYIEIAKEFSSPSSGKFINGVLDNLIKDLTDKGLIVKTGRGLIS